MPPTVAEQRHCNRGSRGSTSSIAKSTGLCLLAKPRIPNWISATSISAASPPKKTKIELSGRRTTFCKESFNNLRIDADKLTHSENAAAQQPSNSGANCAQFATVDRFALAAILKCPQPLDAFADLSKPSGIIGCSNRLVCEQIRP